MTDAPTLLLLPGDGIGPEIMAQARRGLDWLATRRGLAVEMAEAPVGGAAIDGTGKPLPPATLASALAADGVLLGAVGGPKWDGVEFALRPEAGLLALRSELELFANLRPALIFEALIDASSLKPEMVRGLDLMIVRELTGGIYFGEPRGIEELGDGVRRGFNTQSYTTPEIARIARVAFELARARSGRLVSADKANVMESGRLWREVVGEIGAAEFPDVALSHIYADNCAMQLVRAPTQFDVILTDNLFGDMLSDEAAMATGSLGMLPSASLGAPDEQGRRKAMYEPVHGSAPDIAGQDRANPLAMLMSLAMALEWSLGREAEARLLRAAIAAALAEGARTADIAGPADRPLGTQAMGRAVLDQLDRLS